MVLLSEYDNGRLDKFVKAAAALFAANGWTWHHNETPGETDIWATAVTLVSSCERWLYEHPEAKTAYSSTGRIMVTAIRTSRPEEYPHHEYRFTLDVT